MKSAICFSWIVVTFLLLDGLSLPSLQLKRPAQIFAEDFDDFDRQNDSSHSSTIFRLRAGNQRLAMGPMRAATASEGLFHFAFPEPSALLPTSCCKQNLHIVFNVVLRI
jgi:hypothetical protein